LVPEGCFNESMASHAPNLLKPRDTLGPYRIDALIGKGGMGEVYRGTDTRLGRSVAIKVSAREFSDRFEREARAISSLNHPNICTLYDVGPNYLVMEFVEGDPLSNLTRQGPMPLEKALQCAVQIADALSAAHAKGVIHRDLKPANIILTKSGVKVLDFGLASSVLR
jgi:serine/threonine protein kinase